MASERADKGLQTRRYADCRQQSLSDRNGVEGQRGLPSGSEWRTRFGRAHSVARLRHRLARQLRLLQHRPATEAVSIGWLEILRHGLVESRAEVRLRLSENAGLFVFRVAGTDRGILAIQDEFLLQRARSGLRMCPGQAVPRLQQ